MAITFTINVGGGANPLTHNSIGSSTSRTLTINSISSTDSNNVSDYSFTWYFIDKPTSTNSTITNDTGLHPDKNVVTVNSIDQWGTYRIFCIARHKGTNNRSESNPLKAPESSFFNIRVQGPNFDLEKPAKGQRNWQNQYNTLIQKVSDNMGSGGSSYTDTNARSAISVTDSGGDGSLSYNNSSGVITYTGPSATEVRSHFSAGSGIAISNGAISSTITQYSNSDARSAISVTDSGGDGSLSYNNGTGVITYTGPSATEVRSHFSAGSGISISNGTIAATGGSSGDFLPKLNPEATGSLFVFRDNTSKDTYFRVRNYQVGSGKYTEIGSFGNNGDPDNPVNTENLNILGDTFAFQKYDSTKIVKEQNLFKISGEPSNDIFLRVFHSGSNANEFVSFQHKKDENNNHEFQLFPFGVDPNNSNFTIKAPNHLRLSVGRTDISGNAPEIKLRLIPSQTDSFASKCIRIRAIPQNSDITNPSGYQILSEQNSDEFFALTSTSGPMFVGSEGSDSSLTLYANESNGSVTTPGNSASNTKIVLTTNMNGEVQFYRPKQVLTSKKHYLNIKSPNDSEVVIDSTNGYNISLVASGSSDVASKIRLTNSGETEVYDSGNNPYLTLSKDSTEGSIIQVQDDDLTLKTTGGTTSNVVVNTLSDFIVKNPTGKRLGIEAGLVGIYNTNDQTNPYIFFDQTSSGNASKPIVGSYIKSDGDLNITSNAGAADINIFTTGKGSFNVSELVSFNASNPSSPNKTSLLSLSDAQGLNASTSGPITLNATSVSLGSAGFSSTIFIGYTNQANTVNIGNSTVGGGSTVNIGSTSNPTAHQINLNADDIRLSFIPAQDSSVNELVIGKNAVSGQLHFSSTLTMFTGGHIYKCSENISLSPGDVVCLNNNNLVLPISSNMKTVCGIISKIQEATDSEPIETSLGETVTSGFCARVASVGDNRHKDCEGFKVCNENGPIEAGDLLVTSSRPGYLMKQDDDIIRSKTVGKAMVDVVFDEDGLATNIYGFIYCG